MSAGTALESDTEQLERRNRERSILNTIAQALNADSRFTLAERMPQSKSAAC